MSLDDQNWSHPPLLYNVSGIPILPLPSSKNMVVRVLVGETITLSCPGSKVNRTKSNMAVVKCVQKDMFLLNTTIVDIDQLDCTRNPSEKEMLARKGEGCGPELSDRISQPGFQLERELRTMFTVCYAICMGRSTVRTSPTTPC